MRVPGPLYHPPECSRHRIRLRVVLHRNPVVIQWPGPRRRGSVAHPDSSSPAIKIQPQPQASSNLNFKFACYGLSSIHHLASPGCVYDPSECCRHRHQDPSQWPSLSSTGNESSSNSGPNKSRRPSTSSIDSMEDFGNPVASIALSSIGPGRCSPIVA